MSFTLQRYRIGSLIKLDMIFTDASGVPITPDAVRFKIKDPDGIIQAWTYGINAEILFNSESRQYSVEINADKPWEWFYRWESEGNYQTAVEGKFVVLSSRVAYTPGLHPLRYYTQDEFRLAIAESASVVALISASDSYDLALNDDIAIQQSFAPGGYPLGLLLALTRTGHAPSGGGTKGYPMGLLLALTGPPRTGGSGGSGGSGSNKGKSIGLLLSLTKN